MILERSGHLSFPIIYRKDDKIYVYPENSEDGVLNIYEYNPINDDMTLIHELFGQTINRCQKPTEICLGNSSLFTTQAEYANELSARINMVE